MSYETGFSDGYDQASQDSLGLILALMLQIDRTRLDVDLNLLLPFGITPVSEVIEITLNPDDDSMATVRLLPQVDMTC